SCPLPPPPTPPLFPYTTLFRSLFALDATAAAHPGTTALREHLHQMAAQTRSRPDEGLFRLAVVRVFTLAGHGTVVTGTVFAGQRSEEHTSELQSQSNLVCRLLL